jgi:hypothetical protein
MATIEFSDLQIEAIRLAREIKAFADKNRYKPNDVAIEEFKKQFGDDGRLVYRSASGDLYAAGSPGGPAIGLYLDNSEWVKALAEKYADSFKAKVESVRLKFVKAGIICEQEMWYTQCFMTESRIRMVGLYLVSAAFLAEEMSLAPNLATRVFPSPTLGVGYAEAIAIG